LFCKSVNKVHTKELMMIQSTASDMTGEIEALGPWFHNLHLPSGVQTAPNHFLGDFPTQKWLEFRDAIPQDLRGWTALDIGCNAGFYSFELAKRGAHVTSIDYDERYLTQARWAAKQFGLERQICFERMQVYDLARDAQTFDIVWFMGVLYHLRYPLLGLDIVARKTRKLLVLQTLTSPGERIKDTPEDMGLDERTMMLEPGWPTMAFIEHRLERDPTNWWAPNKACVEAMVRSAGLEIVARPAHEITLCRPASSPRTNENLLEQEYLAACGLPFKAANHER
jgi:tRNA (mo5U34)-methyltransferase